MVAFAHIGDHGHLTAVKAQTFTQDAAARALQNGGIHLGVGQHIACTLGTRAVAAIDLAAIHIDAIGIGHAHAQAL